MHAQAAAPTSKPSGTVLKSNAGTAASTSPITLGRAGGKVIKKSQPARVHAAQEREATQEGNEGFVGRPQEGHQEAETEAHLAA